MSRHAERPLPVHLVYLAEACRIEPWLRDEALSMFMPISVPIPPKSRC